MRNADRFGRRRRGFRVAVLFSAAMWCGAAVLQAQTPVRAVAPYASYWFDNTELLPENFAVVQAIPPPIVTANQFFGFDYKPGDITAFAIVRFEIQVDTGAWTSVAIPPKANDAQTLAGYDTYKTPIPAMVPADHTVLVRACNAQLCGDASAPFTFTLAVKPPTVAGLRVVGSR